jgi:hypothetical protein
LFRDYLLMFVVKRAARRDVCTELERVRLTGGETNDPLSDL